MAGDLIVVPPEVFAATAADYIADAIRAASTRSGPITVALSGGKSPGPVYQRLARSLSVPWGRVEIYFADERAVAPTSQESNYRLVNETLVINLPGGVAAVHRMEAERSDRALAAEEYETVLPARLDVLVLGMGEDGHTASLFPRHPAVSEKRRRVLAVEGSYPPRDRLTITPPVMNAARLTLMLVEGANKAPAVVRALRGPDDPLACPATLARNGVWILDQPAGAQLRSDVS